MPSLRAGGPQRSRRRQAPALAPERLATLRPHPRRRSRFEPIEGTARIAARAEGGPGRPDWALRTWRARPREGGEAVSCALLGRTSGGRFGLLRPDGAYSAASGPAVERARIARCLLPEHTVVSLLARPKSPPSPFASRAT